MSLLATVIAAVASAPAALSNGDVSVVLFNENSAAATISTTASAVGAASSSSYKLTNLWSNVVTSTSGAISATVPGHGSVMYRVAAVVAEVNH